MTAGGIYPAIVGTFWLVGVSLAIAAPIGVLAGIYLNEYAPENWLTRIIHLAIVNLAGRAEHRARAVRRRRVRAVRCTWAPHLGGIAARWRS